MIIALMFSNYQYAFAAITISIVNSEFDQEEAVIGDRILFSTDVNGIEDVMITELLFQNVKKPKEVVKVNEISRDDQTISAPVSFPTEGQWYLKKATFIADGEKRYEELSLPQPKITVYRSAKQIKNAIVSSVTYKKNSMTTNETNKVYVNVDKKIKDVKRVFATATLDVNKDVVAQVEKCEVTSIKNRYSCDIEVPKHAPSGKYNVSNVTVFTKDKVKSLSVDDHAIAKEWPSFTVKNDLEDKEAPMLLDVEVVGQSQQVGQPMGIEVKAIDNLSKVNEISTVFENTKTKKKLQFSSFKYASKNTYKSNAVLPSKGAGTWQLKTVKMTDNTGNLYIRSYNKNGYKEETVNVLNKVKEKKIIADELINFTGVTETKVSEKSKTGFKVDSYSYRNVVVLNGEKEVATVKTGKTGQQKLTFEKQASNTELEVQVQLNNGATTERLTVTVP